MNINCKTREHLKSLLNIAIKKCDIKDHSNTKKINENFDCNQICSKPKEISLIEMNETKNMLFLFGLILFYALIKR